MIRSFYSTIAPLPVSGVVGEKVGTGSCNFPTAICNFPTGKIMGAQNFNFASKFLTTKLGIFAPNYVFLKENFRQEDNFPAG